MSQREQFGHHLLLKKLTDDPLGETFRARVLGGPRADRIVLLRVLNGQGVDGERLWEACHDRKGVQDALHVPNIADGLELGQLDGIPYASWAYVSGKNLAELLEQAARKQQFIPAEHALLVTERLALALATAYENRHQGERILHGFLVPHLAMISSEGETRLLGFEIAPGLRTGANHPVIRQHFGRYLSPEALAGAARETKDDIYSLAVVLYELLTGRPFEAGPEGAAATLDSATLAIEGTPLPDELRELLRQSLAPREERPKDVVAWHKALNQWMFQGGYNPTTFNLAFFMHNLFGDEIAQESEEIELEKTMSVPVVQPEEPATATPASGPAAGGPAPGGPAAGVPATGVPAAGVPAAGGPAPGGPAAGVPAAGVPAAGVPAAGAPSAEAGGPSESTGTVPVHPIAERRSNTGLIAGLAAAVVILAAVAGYFWWSSRSEPAASTPVAQVPPPPPSPVIPPGPTEEELAAEQEDLEARIAELVDKQTTNFEDQVRSQYEDQLAKLQQQLEDAKAAAERRRQLEEELLAEEAAAPPADGDEAGDETTAPGDAATVAQEGAPAAAGAGAEESTAPAAPEGELEVAEVTPPPASPPPPAAAPPPPSPPPPPPPPQVRRGDLVEMGPGVTPPVPVGLAPRFPEPARRINKREATVTVQVLVDENGKPLEARIVGKEVGFGFDQEALNAVKRANYRAATKNGVPVKVWFTFKVQFKN